MRRTSQSALLHWGRTRSWEGATDPSRFITHWSTEVPWNGAPEGVRVP